MVSATEAIPLPRPEERMRKPNSSLFSLYLISAISLVGCGKNTTDTGTAKLKFSNTQNNSVGYLNIFNSFFMQKAFAATMSAPTEFKMKLVAAYLSSDIDPVTQNNIGTDAIFYENPECAGDLKHCDVGAGTAVDGTPYTHLISTAFDFGQSSTEVNAALNAQGASLPTGQYKYVRLEFCKVNEANAPNVEWQGGLNNTETAFDKSSCTVNSAVMNPPLVLNKGDTATIQLAYDYSNSIQVGADAQGDNCTGSGDSTTCFTVPHFIPTATK